MQERRNSTANGLELHLSCTNPSMWYWNEFLHDSEVHCNSVIEHCKLHLLPPVLAAWGRSPAPYSAVDSVEHTWQWCYCLTEGGPSTQTLSSWLRYNPQAVNKSSKNQWRYACKTITTTMTNGIFRKKYQQWGILHSNHHRACQLSWYYVIYCTLQFIWWLVACRRNLWLPNLQISCNDLTSR